jgi:uncharacterized membrane protein
MSASEWILLALRLVHSLAAMVWLGGGVYLLLVMRPAIREQDEPPRAFLAATSEHFREWAQVATIAMVASGVVLMLDRLSNGSGGWLYVTLLVTKIVAALAAFWLAGVRPVRRRARTSGTDARRATPELLVMLGLLAFVLGVGLSSVYGRAG